ncbi:hypothetical protein HDU76_001149, partial [Blyttiomyces sp. JEL0837]
ITSAYGLRSVVERLHEMRTKRYNRLKRLYASVLGDSSSERQIKSLSSYLLEHNTPDQGDLADMFLEYTEPMSLIASAVMDATEVRSVLSYDASRKLMSRARVSTSTGARVNLPEHKLLWIAMNEIGQVVGRKIVPAESHEHLEPFLKTMLNNVKLDQSAESVVRDCVREADGGKDAATTGDNNTFAAEVINDGMDDDEICYMDESDDEADGVEEQERDESDAAHQDITTEPADIPDLFSDFNEPTAPPGDSHVNESRVNESEQAVDDSGYVSSDEDYYDALEDSREFVDRILYQNNLEFPQINPKAKILVVTDNVTAHLKCIQAMGEEFHAGQDPWHLYDRFSPSVPSEMKGQFCAEMKNAIYYQSGDLEGEFRPRDEMFYQVRTILFKYYHDMKRAKKLKKGWLGKMASNLKQIWRGDFVPVGGTNRYYENGEVRKRLASSQNEGLHSQLNALCKQLLSLPLLLRDVLYAQKLLSTIPDAPSRHHAWVTSPGPNSAATFWKKTFNLPPASQALTERFISSPNIKITNFFSSTRSLGPFKNIKTAWMERLLYLTPRDIDERAPFTTDESFLLVGIIKAQRAQPTSTDRDWRNCDIVTTILFNHHVLSNENGNLRIQPKSYENVQCRINNVSLELTSDLKTSDFLKLRVPPNPPSPASRPTSEESNIMLTIKSLIMASGRKEKIKTFTRVFDFIARTSDSSYVYHRRNDELRKFWFSLGQAQRRQKKKGEESPQNANSSDSSLEVSALPESFTAMLLESDIESVETAEGTSTTAPGTNNGINNDATTINSSENVETARDHGVVVATSEDLLKIAKFASSFGGHIKRVITKMAPTLTASTSNTETIVATPVGTTVSVTARPTNELPSLPVSTEVHHEGSREYNDDYFDSIFSDDLVMSSALLPQLVISAPSEQNMANTSSSKRSRDADGN